MSRLLDHRLAYRLLLWLLLPYSLLHLWWRGRRQPEYRQHLGERFGRYAQHSNKPLIWLHTVSVGETRAAATLVRTLREQHPNHQILLTHMTPTGRATSKQLFGDEVLRVYLPYDYPFAVRRFLRHFHPQIGVLLETEVWPNLIQECHAAHLPLLLLNARLSEKSARRYARFPRLTHDALHALHLIAAQTEADATRLSALCGRSIPVMGNLKFDLAPPAAQLEVGTSLRTAFGSRPVFLAASTREGEEALLLDAWCRVDVGDALLVIVPRHPQRFDEVAALIAARGLSCQRRSGDTPVAADTRVLLGDSMGELFAYYAACDVAFIGGSLLPFGGQNLIEAAACGKPVLLGPHTYNFAEASAQALAQGAARRCADAQEVIAQGVRLLADADERQHMGAAGLAFVAANQGATARAAGLIDAALRQNF